jgi:hypothetical protein
MARCIPPKNAIAAIIICLPSFAAASEDAIKHLRKAQGDISIKLTECGLIYGLYKAQKESGDKQAKAVLGKWGKCMNSVSELVLSATNEFKATSNNEMQNKVVENIWASGVLDLSAAAIKNRGEDHVFERIADELAHTNGVVNSELEKYEKQ